MTTYQELRGEFDSLADPHRALNSAWFFKTGPGQYGEGDVFIGIPVPVQQKLARQYSDLALPELKELLDSEIHEHRLTALLILRRQYEKAKSEPEAKQLVDFYLQQRDRVNNWDLVDSSAPYILGHYLLDRPKDQLFTFAKSKDLWERRIAIIATAAFIKMSKFETTLKLAQALLTDREDLIHKAVGWMLREVGNKNETVLRQFLDTYAAQMPRTMLRYAIEKLSQPDRQHYLAKKQEES